MALAENASSRKEAKHYINQSTKIMNNSKKDCWYSVEDLRRLIQLQESNLRKAEASANTARQMLEMLHGVLSKQEQA